MLSTITNSAILGFVAAAVWAPVLIWLLYKFNMVIRHRLLDNGANEEFIKIHGHKSGTPRTGGLIISIPLYILSLVLLPPSGLKLVFLIGITLFTVYGLADDMLVSFRKLSDKVRELLDSFGWRLGKLLVLFGINLTLVYLLVEVAGINSITLWQNLEFLGEASTVQISLNEPVQLEFLSGIFQTVPQLASWLVWVLLSLIMTVALYGIELTDGADGLVTGQFLILLVAYGVIAAITSTANVPIILGILLGACLVYLYFNITPARVFMGATGTLPIGFSLILFAILTDTLLIFLIMGALFWIEVLSSFVQLISIRYFDKKIFKIAPIHHHFEAIGWSEAKVVQRFWLFGIVMAVLGLWLLSNVVLG